MDVESAYNLIENAISAGRPAHGYLIVGDVRGDALELAERVLVLLFGPEHVKDHAHPDIHWLAPELKSRVISVESMHERLVDPMSQTAFSGGWKAGVVIAADRMKKESANAFLKTLEEPTPQTIFLLLTSCPEQILPTIISRCQRIDLMQPGERRLAEPWLSRVLTVLSDPAAHGVVGKAAAAMRFAGILEELKEKAEELVNEETADEDDGPGEESTKEQFSALVSSRYREFRTDFALTADSWFRDIAVVRTAGSDVPLRNPDYRAILVDRASRITKAQAFRNVEAVEEMSRAFDRNMKEDTVLFAFTDAVQFGVEVK